MPEARADAAFQTTKRASGNWKPKVETHRGNPEKSFGTRYLSRFRRPHKACAAVEPSRPLLPPRGGCGAPIAPRCGCAARPFPWSRPIPPPGQRRAVASLPLEHPPCSALPPFIRLLELRRASKPSARRGIAKLGAGHSPRIRPAQLVWPTQGRAARRAVVAAGSRAPRPDRREACRTRLPAQGSRGRQASP